MLDLEATMVQISAQGMRNEHWRRRLLLGLMVPDRYATVWISEGAREHPGAVEALASLLTCPAQHDPLVNVDGDCDWLRTSVDDVGFDLFVNCYAHSEQPKRGSDDPSDDYLTTRLYSLMLSSEYSEPGSGPA